MVGCGVGQRGGWGGTEEVQAGSKGVREGGRPGGFHGLEPQGAAGASKLRNPRGSPGARRGARAEGEGSGLDISSRPKARCGEVHL